MRRYKKKELLETADMLVEANEVIGRLCKSNTDGALELLGQCQESAILIGNLIESKGDGYAELVEILENYCENIYQMSIAVSDEEQIRKLSKKIQKQLTYLNNKIRHEIPEDKKEVVFFPYKASMWDSLESVWMAADADEGTDAYVVPIPYYDKNPDGTFREMHYEGDQYPDYVPVTNYEEYDFEERRPDIIFIHNPYDQFNYVTSVHPRFYSGNLKQYTEKLVYIPYFILGEIKPDDEEALKGMKHFCVNEAVKNADRVIVQSEDMRQVYIEVLTRESGGSKEARAYWEGKIDGSGSPKVDKVLRTKKKDLEIPEEWLKIIRKMDGSWKKIIFYNTSVTAMLQHDEQMLKKIESVFQIFRENRDEVALLWRPHPLMESTLISMRPELWEKYREIRKKYIEEGWGIYDDTVDMDRAVVVSDGYYGDWSSIVHLYQKTRKLVMIQNCQSKNKKNDNRWHPQITNGFWIDNKMFFSAANYNGLFSIDIRTGNVYLVGKLEEEAIDSVNLTSNIEESNNKIIISPCTAKNTYIFDREEGNITVWNTKKLKNQSFSTYRIEDKVAEEKIFFIIPTYGTIFGKIRNDFLGLENVIDFMKEYQKWTGERYIICSDSGVYIYNGYLYFAALECNLLVKINIVNHKIRFININNKEKGFYKILGKDKYLFLLCCNNEIIIYDLEIESIISILCSRELVNDKGLYRDGFYWNDCFYFMSYISNKCIKILLMDKKIEVTTLEKEWGIKTEMEEEYRYTTMSEGFLYLVSNKDNFIGIDLRTGKFSEVNLQFNVELIKKYLSEEIERHIANSGVIHENDCFYHLADFLCLLMEKRSISDSKSITEIGKRIYTVI